MLTPKTSHNVDYNGCRTLNPAADLQLELDISFRFAREEDLESMEWFGLFRDHREIIRRVYEAQGRGENLILLALHNNLPVGQCWIDLQKRAEENAGVLWALRVIPWLQGRGIGSRLIRLAEEELFRREYAAAEIGVEKNNAAAEALYRRLGYTRAGSLCESYSYRTPEGALFHIPLDEWIYRKELRPPAPFRPRKAQTARSTARAETSQHNLR